MLSLMGTVLKRRVGQAATGGEREVIRPFLFDASLRCGSRLDTGKRDWMDTPISKKEDTLFAGIL